MNGSYRPDGTGHCKLCDRDVGAHVDPAHKFVPPLSSGASMASEGVSPACDAIVIVTLDGADGRCGLFPEDPIHDVGRVLRCPGDWTKIIGAMPDFPPPEVRDD